MSACVEGLQRLLDEEAQTRSPSPCLHLDPPPASIFTQTQLLIIDEAVLVFTYPGSPGALPALPAADHIVVDQNQKRREG